MEDRLQNAVNHCSRLSKLRKRKAPKRCYLYAIQAGDFVKIGVASSVTQRIQSLQTGCHLELKLLDKWLSDEPYADEWRLHRKLKAYAARAEWFKLSPESWRIIQESKHS